MSRRNYGQLPLPGSLGALILLGAAMGCGGVKTAIERRMLVGLAVDPSDGAANVGDQVPLSATATFNQPPISETNFAAQWSSSDLTIATIDPNTGTPTCVAVGGPIAIIASASSGGGMIRRFELPR